MFDDDELQELNSRLESTSVGEILRWTWHTFKQHIAVTSSFQTQSVPLLHLISENAPQLPILFLDTGFHFPETLRFRDELIRRYDLNVINLYPRVEREAFDKEYGELHMRDPDMCCHINKVEPLKRALQGYRGWISGIRRDQTTQRRDTRFVSRQAENLYKICPLADWTNRRIWQYINDNDLPVHPLFSQGYLSIGCAPCTYPVYGNGDRRSGRWAKSRKVECGIHTDSFTAENTRAQLDLQNAREKRQSE